MDTVKNKVKEFLTRFSLENKNILIAFSGGFDSMCLLNVLNELKSEFNLTLTAIHLNHGWRGKESDMEEENCRNFAKKLNVTFYCSKLPATVKHTETEARDARYEFFNRCAKKFNSKFVFTAHNYNDNAETLLYRITKGTGIDGLKGIAEHRDIYYRPLLQIERAEIENYCKTKKLNPNSDSSNKNSKYNRNRIRLKILPELETVNKDVIYSLNNLAQNAIENEDIISQYLATLTDKLKTEKFMSYSSALQNRIIYEILKENNFETTRSTVLKLVKFIKENSCLKNGKTISIDEKNFLFVNKSEIRIINKALKEEKLFVKIDKEGTYKIGNNIFRIKKYTQKPKKFPKDNECKAFVDLSATGIDFVLRTRKDGDIIQPLGINGTQKLKKYLSEKSIPKDLRDNIALLCKNNEVFWAITLGINDKIKVLEKATHVIEWIKDK